MHRGLHVALHFTNSSILGHVSALFAVSILAGTACGQDSSPLASVSLEELEMGPNAGTQPRPAEERPVAPVEPATPRFHATFGLDVPSQYFYRGIANQTEGSIVQSFADFSLDFYRAADFTISATMGTWESVHGEDSAASATDRAVRHWFESDVYAGIAASVDNWVVDARYYWYTSPSGAFGTIEEVYFSVAYDDTELMGDWSLQPTAVLTFETSQEQADGGTARGSYLQLGVSPGVSWDMTEKTAIDFSFPVTVGLSASNFYEGPNGENDFFGFASIGAEAAYALPIDASWGAWSISAGVQMLLLGDAASAINNDDSSEFIATFGVEVAF